MEKELKPIGYAIQVGKGFVYKTGTPMFGVDGSTTCLSVKCSSNRIKIFGQGLLGFNDAKDIVDYYGGKIVPIYLGE